MITGRWTANYQQLTENPAFARTTNQRPWWQYWPRRMGNEGEQQRIVYEMTTVTYDTITMMMQRSERNFFDLFGQRQQHNDEAGMRINVLHRQRLQQHTGGWALEGLDKGGLVSS